MIRLHAVWSVLQVLFQVGLCVSLAVCVALKEEKKHKKKNSGQCKVLRQTKSFFCRRRPWQNTRAGPNTSQLPSALIVWAFLPFRWFPREADVDVQVCPRGLNAARELWLTPSYTRVKAMELRLIHRNRNKKYCPPSSPPLSIYWGL